jgi:hypothetical protein
LQIRNRFRDALEAETEMSNDNANVKGSGGPKVEFEHVGTSRDVEFHASEDETLQQLWDKAVDLLQETRGPQDRLQSFKGTDLMPYLNLTLAQLKDEKIIDARKFQIVGPTGGA